MAGAASSGRSAAIAAFAARLRELREAAGNPSFREMAGRSSAISHTTLHEAAQGHRLPSWPTTVEFVRACGTDPDVVRAQWEAADSTPVATTPEPTPAHEPPTVPEPAAPSRRRLALVVGIPAAVVVIVAIALLVALPGDGDAGPGRRDAVSPAARYTAADCPVQQRQPPSAAPAHPGDHARFIGDITVPDCSHVRRGTTFTKTWRFKNVGTVAWRDYSLRRIDDGDSRKNCQTIREVPVPDARPGGMVNVSTQVTAPPDADFCFVRFRFVDAAGADAFPAGRPVNFQVIVD